MTMLLTLGWVGLAEFLHPIKSQAHPSQEKPGSMMGHGGHTAKVKEIPNGQPIPTVKLIARPDVMKGWNVEVQVTNFRFAPERVNQSSDVKEGHAHLYLNGQKIARLYGNWYHLESLKPGKHTLTITLNTNTHEDLTYKGKVISASTLIEVPKR
ncbi:MAG: hypothetical protein SFW36_01950 [Leptolyngbyaceae cyanobacterium bins.59]|nr:hypothetical protein [Leptolyngbyaceae cyanobacterium bins.59]